jgi:UTP-glucose-1-phosphate uridylyltransferase
MKVRKAVFPIVGLGTRFLPATKAMAKEMLPIVDKPLIQYAVKQTCKYGILDADPLVDGITKIRGLVEKPQPEAAPSNLAFSLDRPDMRDRLIPFIHDLIKRY